MLTANRRIGALLSIVIAAFALHVRSRAGEVQPERCFMWKATSATTTVYVLGSIHAATEDFYPLAPEIESAFRQSKYLVVEFDVDKAGQAKIQALTAEKGMYKGEETLCKALSKDTLKLLTDYCEGRKIPITALDKFRPWAVAMMIQRLELEKLGFQRQLGIDQHFLNNAKEKEVLELETAESQADLMAGFSAETQENFLAQVLLDLSELKEMITATAEAWKKGDAAALDAQVIGKTLKKHPEMKPVFEKMNDDRNTKMAEKIDGYLKTKDVHFVVVGSAHLIGQKGIVRLLESKGYKIEQVAKARQSMPELVPVGR